MSDGGSAHHLAAVSGCTLVVSIQRVVHPAPSEEADVVATSPVLGGADEGADALRRRARPACRIAALAPTGAAAAARSGVCAVIVGRVLKCLRHDKSSASRWRGPVGKGRP